MDKELLTALMDALKAKFEGVSDNVLERVARKVGKTLKNKEEVTTAVEGVTIMSIIEGYGDSRATEAQERAVKTYETKYGLKDGKQVKGDPEPNPDDDQMPAWAKQLLEDNKSLKEQVASFGKDRTVRDRRERLSTITDKLPEALRKGYERINIDDFTEEQFNTLTSEITKEVEDILAENKSKGAVFGRPGTATKESSAKVASEDEVKAVMGKLNIKL